MWSIPNNAPRRGPALQNPYIQSGWLRPKITVQAGAGLLVDRVSYGKGYKKKAKKRVKK